LDPSNIFLPHSITDFPPHLKSSLKLAVFLLKSRLPA
jgi:hypothetical protein